MLRYMRRSIEKTSIITATRLKAGAAAGAAALLSLALALPAVQLASPHAAWGETYEGAAASPGQATEPNLPAALKGDTSIEQLTVALHNANAQANAAAARTAEIQVDIDAIRAILPAQQARSDAGMRQRYIMQSNPLAYVDEILASQTFGDFMRQTEYLDRITQSNLDELNRTRDLKNQLDAAMAEQQRVQDEAQANLEAAQAALQAEQAQRAEKQASGIAAAVASAGQMGGDSSVEVKLSDEEVRALENGAGASTAAEASSGSSPEAGSASEPTSESTAGSDSSGSSTTDTATAESPSATATDAAGNKPVEYTVAATTDTSPLNDGANWYADRDEFLAEWTPRLDAYLQGSALEGQGANFAASAWKHCIDPRYSAAISNIESGKGRLCIRPYNAWGWGAADSDPSGLAKEWSSWEEAIEAHTAGLENGYGYTISMSGARKYCPYNWQEWYNTTLNEMAKI